MFQQNFAVFMCIAFLFNLVPVHKVIGIPVLPKHKPKQSKLEVAADDSQRPEHAAKIRLFPDFPSADHKNDTSIEDDAHPPEVKPTKKTVKPRRKHLKLWAADDGSDSSSGESSSSSSSDSSDNPPGDPTESSDSSGQSESQSQSQSSGDQSQSSGDQSQSSGDQSKPSKPSSSGDSDSNSGAGKEMTISVPKFKTDKWGNWVYNPWAVTFGQVWQDTRFKIGGSATIPRMYLDSKPVKNYYGGSGPLSTVCMGKSTIYNLPKVHTWLKRNIYNYTHRHRPIWISLRREMFINGRSEECHTKEYDKFRPYAECAMRRNMRMEYMIPKYPLHQVGYHGHYWRPGFDKK